MSLSVGTLRDMIQSKNISHDVLHKMVPYLLSSKGKSKSRIAANKEKLKLINAELGTQFEITSITSNELEMVCSKDDSITLCEDAYGYNKKDDIDVGVLDAVYDPVVDLETKIAIKFLNLKRSAQSRNKDFNLTLAEVRRLIKTKRCFYTKKKFDIDGPFALSIDRVDCNKGYIIGNVVACTIWANHFKNSVFENKSSPLFGLAQDMQSVFNKMENL